MAAGTISFFGTRRVVVLPELDPAAYGSKDLDELCSTLSSLENAVAVLGSVFPLERSKLKLGKQAQKLQAQCKAIGYTEELAKPRPAYLKLRVRSTKENRLFSMKKISFIKTSLCNVILPV